MPVTPMFHVHAWGFPYIATLLGVKQVYPGRYVPGFAGRLDRAGRSDLLALRADDPADGHRRRGKADPVSLKGWKVVIGGAALPTQLAAPRGLEEGIDLFTGYGMSETAPDAGTGAHQADMEGCDIDRQVDVRCTMAGRDPDGAVRIVDEAMNDVPA